MLQKSNINDAIQCDLCQFWVHRKCNRLSTQDLMNLENFPDKWHCMKCISDTFDTLPFSNPCEPNKAISQPHHLKDLFRNLNEMLENNQENEEDNQNVHVKCQYTSIDDFKTLNTTR